MSVLWSRHKKHQVKVRKTSRFSHFGCHKRGWKCPDTLSYLVLSVSPSLDPVFGLSALGYCRNMADSVSDDLLPL